jgi:hypothetical protein
LADILDFVDHRYAFSVSLKAIWMQPLELIARCCVSDLAETDNEGIVKMHMESVFQEDCEGAGFGEIMFIYRQVERSWIL